MIASVLLLEYGVLGALAGTIGSVGAIALTWGISRFALDIPWRAAAAASAPIGIVVSAVLVVAVVGVVASWEVLQRKPLRRSAPSRRDCREPAVLSDRVLSCLACPLGPGCGSK